MKLRKIIFLLLIFFSAWVSGQSVSPQTVSSAGTQASVSGISISFNVGETAVTTNSIGGITFTQGFEQPDPIIKSSSATPVITVSTNSLSAFSTIVGTPSATQNFTISGTNLTANISLSAPTNFEISFSSSSGFSGSLSLTQSSGIVSATTVYVRYNPSTSGSHSGNIVCSSAGATSQNVAVSGTSTNPTTPVLVANPSSLTAFSTIVGTPSANQTFTVSGLNLTGNATITAPTEFEISLSSSSGFGTSLTLTPSSGTISSTTIYTRYNPASSGTHSGNITVSGGGATTQNVAVSGTSTLPTNPTIIVTPASLTFVTSVGNASTPKTINVSALNLTGNLSVSAPAFFEVSLSVSSGYSSSLSLSPTSGVVPSTVVYVRYNPVSAATDTGRITLSSTGATIQYVSVSGTATLGVLAAENNISIDVFPNPSSSLANAIIVSDKNKNISLNLYDLSGKELRNIYSGKIKEGENKIPFQVNDISDGIYFLRISENENFWYKRIQILR